MHDGPSEGKQSRAPGSITSTGIKGDRLLSSFVITFASMKKPRDAENAACATGWFCLSCDLPTKRSRKLSFTKIKITKAFLPSIFHGHGFTKHIRNSHSGRRTNERDKTFSDLYKQQPPYSSVLPCFIRYRRTLERSAKQPLFLLHQRRIHKHELFARVLRKEVGVSV